MIRKTKNSLLGHMRFLILFLFVGLQMGIAAYAAPAEYSPQELCQADGSVVTGYARGDEFFSWFEDEYENIIAYDTQTKNWCYAYEQDNMLLPGAEIVGAAAVDQAVLQAARLQREDIQTVIRNNIESSPLNARTANGYAERVALYAQDGNEEGARAAAWPKTNQELLLILIEFNNVPLQKDGQYWSNHYFGNGKSVAQYYKDMSGGLDIFTPAKTQCIGLESELQVHVNYEGVDENINNIPWVTAGVNATVSSEFDGVIKVKFDMPHPIPEYDGASTDSICSQMAMVTMAMKAIKENTDYDFTGFSDNKQVAVIAAGSECSNSGHTGLPGEIWAHTSNFDGDVVGLSGNMLPYMIHGEMYDEDRSVAIGVSCHELGHTLGLPDLYNTQIGTEGIGYYSLMAFGTWGCTMDEEVPGTTPVALDAWSKYMLGYSMPVEYEEKIFDTAEVKSAGEIGCTHSQKYNILKIYNPTVGEKQYFLIENRQNEGWDSGMQFHFGETFSGGILILQIDENIPLDNHINGSDKHRGVNIVGAPSRGPASGNYFYAVDRRQSSLTPDTVPDSMFYSTFASDPILNTRDEPSNITVHIKSECSDRMDVELGVDSDITAEIHDANFLREVRAALGKNNDEPIYKSDLLGITSLDLSDKFIVNLDGIEYFRRLKEFYCYINDIREMNMSGNLELEIFDCSYNTFLTVLDVSKNTKLKNLDCNYTQLATLDVSHSENLISLVCYDSLIEKLDLSHNPQLEILDAWGNHLGTLDVTKNTKIKYLDCSFNYMASIADVRGWQENGLVLGENFIFDPQEGAQISGE